MRGAPLAMALWQIARAPQQTTPLVLLLVMTVGMGTFNAVVARTLDRNFADRVQYNVGADIVMHERWSGSSGPTYGGAVSAADRQLTEPNWEAHR